MHIQVPLLQPTPDIIEVPDIFVLVPSVSSEVGQNNDERFIRGGVTRLAHQNTSVIRTNIFLFPARTACPSPSIRASSTTSFCVRDDELLCFLPWRSLFQVSADDNDGNENIHSYFQDR
jgi:hypothetical protein